MPIGVESYSYLIVTIPLLLWSLHQHYFVAISLSFTLLSISFLALTTHPSPIFISHSHYLTIFSSVVDFFFSLFFLLLLPLQYSLLLCRFLLLAPTTFPTLISFPPSQTLTIVENVTLPLFLPATHILIIKVSWLPLSVFQQQKNENKTRKKKKRGKRNM